MISLGKDAVINEHVAQLRGKSARSGAAHLVDYSGCCGCTRCANLELVT